MTTATAPAPDKPQVYTVGFLFDGPRDFVALITKEKPEWQRGFLNGPGGKVEEGEDPLTCQQREFLEECDADVKGWMHFYTLNSPKAIVHFFAVSKNVNIRSKTSEKVAYYSVPGILNDGAALLPNLRWLLPMALYALAAKDRGEKFFASSEEAR